MVQILQKLLHILNKDQKRKVAGLGVMIFIGALMEMIGVGLIMPVVEGVMAPDQLLNKWYIQILERCRGRQSAPAELLPGGVGRLDGAVRSFGW